jgi:ElaB/YqjD/DUF883 family membrane-anchored ribosome-binding protein
MGQTADQLRQEVDQKRDDAAQKIDQIQAKVDGATQQVKDTVDDAKQQVKDAFDLRKQIEENPLLALGAALAGGFILGGVLGDDDRDDHRYPRDDGGPRTAPYRPQSSSSGVRDSIRKAAKSTGLEDTLNTMVASFMGALGDRVRAIGEEAFPNLMPQQGGGRQQSSQRDTAGASSPIGQPRPMATTETTIPQTDDAPAGASF